MRDCASPSVYQLHMLSVDNLCLPFQQLADTKSNNRKMTLLHYIVRVVEAVFPHAATFYEDLNSVEAASQGIVCMDRSVL